MKEERKLAMIFALVFVLVLTVCLGVSLLKVNSKNDVLDGVMEGKKILFCVFKDGERVVPKEKVVDFNLDTLEWVFTNGSSKNCRVVERGY